MSKEKSAFLIWFEKQFGKRPLNFADSFLAEKRMFALEKELIALQESLHQCEKWDEAHKHELESYKNTCENNEACVALYAWQVKESLKCACQTCLTCDTKATK